MGDRQEAKGGSVRREDFLDGKVGKFQKGMCTFAEQIEQFSKKQHRVKQRH
jgi:hypothetical protein